MPNANTSRGTACGNIARYSSAPRPGSLLRRMIHASIPVIATPSVAVTAPRIRLFHIAMRTALIENACRKCSSVKLAAAGNATAIFCEAA